MDEKEQNAIYKTCTTDLANLEQCLDKYGVAVIPNVLSDQECVDLQNLAMEEFEYVTQGRLRVQDTLTWKQFYDYVRCESR